MYEAGEICSISPSKLGLLRMWVTIPGGTPPVDVPPPQPATASSAQTMLVVTPKLRVMQREPRSSVNGSMSHFMSGPPLSLAAPEARLEAWRVPYEPVLFQRQRGSF